jgi:uncharacterized protein YebE (UPF0316 family)
VSGTKDDCTPGRWICDDGSAFAELFCPQQQEGPVTLSFGEWPIWVGALLIFVARVCDVSLGTMRIAFISRGEKYIAPAFAFFEMLIWLFAISQIVMNLSNLAYYFAYALGFSTGVFTGIRLEEKLAIGSRVIRVITRKDADDLIEALRAAGFGVTSVDAEGNSGGVHLIFSVVKRTDIPHYVDVVQQFNPNAFYSIEDIRFVTQGIFRARRTPLSAARLGRARDAGKK